MIRYPVTIELLSETIFGNGESKNGIVNTEVLRDKNGLPYLFGKTFKGYLRNAIDTILKPYYKSKDEKDFEKHKNSLFGLYKSDKDDKNFDQREGKIRFSNFYLHKDIADIILSCNNKELGTSLLTDIRFTIKVEDGIAKDKSLRASRVLKKRLVFTGYIESDESIDKEEYEFLKEGISALKNLGVNKTRGKGQVKVEIGNEIKEKLQEHKDNGMDEQFNYIFYELELKEPVKLGDSQSKYDYEESKLYITGSSMRGAIINSIIKESKSNKNSDIIDILKKAYFYDAYPIYIKGYKQYFSFPTPNVFRISKEKDKDENKYYKKGEHGYSVAFDISNQDDERKVVKLKKGSFSYYDGDELCQFDVKKDYKFHHSQKINKENIFRYESISKGQRFYGIIDVSKLDFELKKKIIKSMKERNIIYLGGSRTGGYGKTEISSMETIRTFDKLQDKLTYLKHGENQMNYTDIYFLSDAILRDEKHQIISSFSKEYLNDMLDVNVDNIKNDITPTIITGFNSTWQSNLPQVYGIEKGSVLRIMDCGRLDNKNILKFIKMQHGDRKQDGFGRVIINPDFLNTQSIRFVDTQCIEDKEQYSSNNVKVDRDLLKNIRNNIKKYMIDEYVKEYILNAEKNFNLSNSKINDMISIIDKCLKLQDDNFSEFSRELLELEDISQNEERNISNSEALDKIILEKCSLREVIYLEKDKRDKLIREIIPNNINIGKSEDSILLNIIRGILYYKQKELEAGEVNVH